MKKLVKSIDEVAALEEDEEVAVEDDDIDDDRSVEEERSSGTIGPVSGVNRIKQFITIGSSFGTFEENSILLFT